MKGNRPELHDLAVRLLRGEIVELRDEHGRLWRATHDSLAERELLKADAGTQATSVLRTLQSILKAEGRTMRDVVRVGIFLVDMADFAAVNEVYREFFAAPFPARTTVAVAALPFGARVEMEALAR